MENLWPERSDHVDHTMNDELARMHAEAFALATQLFGGEDQARQWMAGPVLGLDGQRPSDLLRSMKGAEVVRDFLIRLEYGVYT